MFDVANGFEFDSNVNDVFLVLNDVYVLNTSGFVVFIKQGSIVFRFVLALRLFLGNQDVVLFNPSADLDNAVLEFSKVTALVRGLRETDWHYVLLALDLRVYECVVDSVKKALVYRA